MEFNQSQWLKSYFEFRIQKRIEAEKNEDKDRKALYKLMSNTIHRKAMEILRNRINVRLVNNEKHHLKWSSKPGYMSHKMFDNNLVVIRKSKVALKLKKPAYSGMCFLELTEVLMYEFHYDYIKNKYGKKSKLLFIGTDSLMYEIKNEDV